jgi:urease accessory protein
MTALPPAFEAYAEEPVPAAAAGSPGKRGELEAVFALVDGRTRLVYDRARVPFHLSGGLDHDDCLPDLATVYVQSPTGGIAQGDRHRAEVRVEAGARAHVTTQSATKVLGMERNYGHAETTLEVGPAGYLEYLPEPTILYGDARLYERIEADVAPDATLLLSSVVVPGRLARGEAFDYDRYRGTVTVRDDGGTVVADTVDLGGETPTDGPGVLGEDAVVGTLYVVAPGDARDLADRLHARVADAAGRAGASTLPRERGAVVRALGRRTDAVTGALSAAWEEARQALVGTGVPERRKP